MVMIMAMVMALDSSSQCCVLSAGKGQREREGGREGRERGEREGEGREGRERGKEGGGRELEGWRGGRVSIN